MKLPNKTRMINQIVEWETTGADGTDGSRFYNAYLDLIQKAYKKELKKKTPSELRDHYKEVLADVKEARGEKDD